MLLAIVASGLIVLVGVIVLASSLLAPVASFGWFAYAPLSGGVFASQGMFIVSQLTLVGAIVLVLGLIGLSLAFGYLWGRRASQQATPD